MLFIVILIHIEDLIFTSSGRFFTSLIKMSFDLIIKCLMNFLKSKRCVIIVIKSLTKKIVFYLFIELINVFESVFFSFYHLKLKNDYVIIMLRNLQQIKNIYNETRLQIKHIKFKIFDYRIFESEHNDKQYYVPRISLVSPDSNNLYISFRRI